MRQEIFTCHDTFYIETFHVVVLIPAPQRINFGDNTYVMRVHLAILDWVTFYQYLLDIIIIIIFFWNYFLALCTLGLPNNPWVDIRYYRLGWLHNYNMTFPLSNENVAPKFPWFASTNTPGILTEWPLLLCWDQSHSSSDRPYRMRCSGGIK